jgi:hypothetical protein
MEPQITLPLSKFKEILLHSWHLIPQDKQNELIGIGISPEEK